MGFICHQSSTHSPMGAFDVRVILNKSCDLKAPEQNESGPDPKGRGTWPVLVVDTDLCDSVVGALPCSGLFTLFLSPVRANRENRLIGQTHTGI